MAAIYDAHVACMHDEMVSSFPEEVTKICVESSLDVEVQVSLVIDSFTERRQIDRKVVFDIHRADHTDYLNYRLLKAEKASRISKSLT